LNPIFSKPAGITEDRSAPHAALNRRADLGAAGIYYRALVGPFASAEKAAYLQRKPNLPALTILG
jgi:hypothetical protein